MTRRLVGFADMRGDALHVVTESLRLAAAITGRPITDAEIRSTLEHAGIAATAEHVIEVEQRLVRSGRPETEAQE